MNMEFKSDDILPQHPGPLMKTWFMDSKGLTIDYVASETSVSEKKLQDIIDGNDSIDHDTAVKLTSVFGSSAETLYRLQDEYNHYKTYRKIKDFDSLPKLSPLVREMKM